MTLPDTCHQRDSAAPAAATVAIWHRPALTDALLPAIDWAGVDDVPLVRVFTYTYPLTSHQRLAGRDPHAVADDIAEHAFLVGTAAVADCHSDNDRALVCAYRTRKLRPLAVGDVVVVGETALRRLTAGWQPWEDHFPHSCGSRGQHSVLPW